MPAGHWRRFRFGGTVYRPGNSGTDGPPWNKVSRWTPTGFRDESTLRDLKDSLLTRDGFGFRPHRFEGDVSCALDSVGGRYLESPPPKRILVCPRRPPGPTLSSEEDPPSPGRTSETGENERVDNKDTGGCGGPTLVHSRTVVVESESRRFGPNKGFRTSPSGSRTVY